MFELSIAFKYLVPKKRHLSVTLIAMMSVAVISLVVWLLLVFLSVTEGMEASWLKKMTELNAPIRITPTPSYFSSYYYRIDALCAKSHYSLKTIGEKLLAPQTDPYDPEEDAEIPLHLPKPDLDDGGKLIDPVRGLHHILTELKQQEERVQFQDYEMSGAMLKLQLLRGNGQEQESLQFLTQVSYLASIPSLSSSLSSLVSQAKKEDINHLFFLANYRMEDALTDKAPLILPSKEASLFQQRIKQLLSHIHIQTVKTQAPTWRLPLHLLPQEVSFVVYGAKQPEGTYKLVLPAVLEGPIDPHLQKGSLRRVGEQVEVSLDSARFFLEPLSSLPVSSPVTFQAKVDEGSVEKAGCLSDLFLHISGSLQQKKLQGIIPWSHLLIDSFSSLSSKEDPIQVSQIAPDQWILPKGGILLPKSFQDHGVLLGDRGFLAYSASTSSSLQEQRIPIFVAGFYDPGILSVGNKCLLVDKEITRAINIANASFTLDKVSLNGVQVWFEQIQKAPEVKRQIEEALKQRNLSSYWKVSSYQEYDFAKELLEQFQSDKILFSLVGLIILIVACCNIISFLILLVQDKKKEIAILRAMGAKTTSIACIFGSCGIIIGSMGSLLGALAAKLTLSNIDSIVHCLSTLQGHAAFHETFYGSSLPNALSSKACIFLFFITPLLSLLAGLIPAFKACKVNPSSTLKEI